MPLTTTAALRSFVDSPMQEVFKQFPWPWHVEEVEDQTHIAPPFYIEDAEGGVVAEAIASYETALAIVELVRRGRTAFAPER